MFLLQFVFTLIFNFFQTSDRRSADLIGRSTVDSAALSDNGNLAV